MPQTDIKIAIDQLRARIGAEGKQVLMLKRDPLLTGSPGASETEDPHPDVPEMHANIMLAFRHLEDARMRLGKVAQAMDGGVSIYDRGA